jgi:hypothetical protein
MPAMAANGSVNSQHGASVVTFTTSSSQSSNSKIGSAVSISMTQCSCANLGSSFSPSDQLEKAVVATFAKVFAPQWELSKKTK